MVSCTESGYRWCWENTYCHPDIPSLCARPRIWWQFEDSNGNDVMETYPYCYGDLYIRSGYSGTFSINGYGFYNAPSWDDIWNRFWIDDYGVHINIQNYDFTPSYNGGRIKVASIGETFTKCVVLVAYDWNTDGIDWVATGTGYGWVGTGGCVSIQCVEAVPKGIRCALGAEYSVPSGIHPFNIWLLYGIDVDGTYENFASEGPSQWASGGQINVESPGQSIVTNIDLTNITLPSGTYDAITIIIDGIDTSIVHDWKIDNDVLVV